MSESPLISIVMPTFKHQWLDDAISSALTQTVQDFEILIGDDSPAELVSEIVKKWDDSRIRYIRNAPEDRGFMRNLNNLIRESKGQYIKFLWDDDVLLPNSLEILLHIFQTTDAKLAFHQRYRIDEKGDLIQAPCCIRGKGQLEMTPEMFFGYIIKYDYNLLGEPTNFMVEAEAFKSLDNAFYIDKIENNYYTDLVLFTNFYKAGYTIWGSNEFGSCFRYNDQQGVSTSSPIYSAEIFEREYLRRWCAELGLLNHRQFMFRFDARLERYKSYLTTYPEFVLIIAAIKAMPKGQYLSESYLDAIQKAYAAIEHRKKQKLAL